MTGAAIGAVAGGVVGNVKGKEAEQGNEWTMRSDGLMLPAGGRRFSGCFPASCEHSGDRFSYVRA